MNEKKKKKSILVSSHAIYSWSINSNVIILRNLHLVIQYVRWDQDTFFIMFPLVQLISFLLIHVSKMYQFSHGSHHSLCELKKINNKKKKNTTLTMFPQVHPINYYLIGKTVGEGGSSTSNVPFTASPYCPIYWAQLFYTPIHCIAAHSFHIYNISQTKVRSQHYKKRIYIYFFNP